MLFGRLLITTHLLIIIMLPCALQVYLYEEFDSEYIFHCHKLVNSTGAIGCDGPLWPRAGVLLPNVSADKLEYIHKYNTSYPFIPILHSWHYNLTSTLIQLSHLEHRIAGVLIVNKNSSERPKDEHPRSDDVACPNEIANQSGCHQWISTPDNLIGSFFRHWPFPIFYLEDPDVIERVENCTLKHNSNLFEMDSSMLIFHGDDWNAGALCSAQLYNPSYSSNGVSADRCLLQFDRTISLDRVAYCENIQVINRWAPLLPMTENINYPNGSILILAVRIDSLTLFAGKAPAADSIYSALIALISITQALAKNKSLFENSTRQVIFAFYNGESLNYIGSTHHVQFLEENRRRKSSPNLDQIGCVLEMNQLANRATDGHSSFWLYSRKSSNTSHFTSISDRLLKWAQSMPNVTLNMANSSVPFPSSSVHSFQNYAHIETGVITNHGTHFTNPYYHSLFDQTFNILSDNKDNPTLYALSAHLAKLGTIVSRSAAEFLNEDIDVRNISVDVDFVNQLIVCLFLNQSCSLFNQIQSPRNYNETNFQNTGTLAPNEDLQQLLVDLMAHLIGSIVNCPDGNHSYAFQYRTKSDPPDIKLCLRYQVFEERAESPYFTSRLGKEERSGLSQWVISHHRPSWASPKLRIFLLPSRTYELLLLCTGIGVFVCSIISVFCCCNL